jgi:siderophore synthetase component
MAPLAMPADTRTVKASYTSPTGKHEFSVPITASCTNNSTAERTRYLGELRANTKALQADINKFLTEKMEQDKSQEAGQKDKKKEEEEREEDNYGEEQAEGED